MPATSDATIRARILDDLATLVSVHGDFLPRSVLLDYTLEGESIPLIDYSRGIRNPRQLDATLSVVSSPDGPYDDSNELGGVWLYAYRSGSDEGDNTRLRRAYELGVDIVLFRKVATGVYHPIFPMRVTHDDRAARVFTIAMVDVADIAESSTPTVIEREWAKRLVRTRVHQPEFRRAVLTAYAGQCAVCRLRHVELLDAAHIIADKDDWGDAEVPNGMSLCKIHHTAYDKNFLGVTPDYEVRINQRLLDEIDGPMLLHGLQEMHGTRIHEPKRSADKPAKDRLAVRFEEFSNA